MVTRPEPIMLKILPIILSRISQKILLLFFLLFLHPTYYSIIVTRFYRTEPNRTSGKIKLTPPVDSYTIVLQVLTLSTTQTTRGCF